MSKPFSLAANSDNLRRLCWIRIIVAACVASSVLLARWLNIHLSLPALAVIGAALAAYTLLCWWRSSQSWPVSDHEFATHLLADVGFITALLYLTGGANNPFVSYFLVPLSIAAATLPWRHTLAMALVCLAAYSGLFIWNIPLQDFAPDNHIHHTPQLDQPFNLHIVGMWINFAISAVLITFFVARMAAGLRHQQQQIARLREDDMHDEQLLAIATLAANTAHELGTPLATMALIIEEMSLSSNHPNEHQSDLDLLAAQIARCKKILQGLNRAAEISPGNPNERWRLDQLLQHTLQQWQLLRPQVTVVLQLASALPAPTVSYPPTLIQALTNLLNNAADACDKDIGITLSWDTHQWQLIICDQGAGLPTGMQDKLGQPFVSSKAQGMGLGLYLSRATISRFGGTVSLQNRPQGGAMTTVSLPLPATGDI